MGMTRSPKPYRVEWRYGANEHWRLMHEADSHEEALELAEDAAKTHGGSSRVIVQHVIARCGAFSKAA